MDFDGNRLADIITRLDGKYTDEEVLYACKWLPQVADCMRMCGNRMAAYWMLCKLHEWEGYAHARHLKW